MNYEFKNTKEVYSEKSIRLRIQNCPKLASLRSIHQSINRLINTEGSYTEEIAEAIRMDPTLATRLLKLVNSVFFSLSYKVTNIEDAIIYLGLRQIKELALATPIIEELDILRQKNANFSWQSFWQHSIGVAMMTRELLNAVNISFLDEMDYLAGLVHNVGKLVIAFSFPKEFDLILQRAPISLEEECVREQNIIGWDHAQIGAFYLERHKLPAAVVEAVRFHHTPSLAPKYKDISAVIQIADCMVRSIGIVGIGSCGNVCENGWMKLEGWQLLFNKPTEESRLSIASLRHTLNKIPQLLEGIFSRELK